MPHKTVMKALHSCYTIRSNAMQNQDKPVNDTTNVRDTLAKNHVRVDFA